MMSEHQEPIVEVVVTAPDEGWLVAFTRRLVEDRPAACGHHSPIRSVYTWDGSLHDQPETRVAIHTQVNQVQAIIDRTNAEHPYEVPCIIATSIVDANPAYRAWIIDATS